MSQKLERIISMREEIIRGRYPTVDHFCEKYEMKPRTVHEYIRYMRENLGMDIRYDRFHPGYFNASPTKSLPQFELTQGEVFALTLGKEMLSKYTGTSFEPVLRSAIDKIMNRLPDRVRIEPADVVCAVKFNPGAVIPVEKAMLFSLNKACEKQRPVRITYHSANKDEITQRVLHPYKLLEHGGAWYAVGWCCLRNDMRYFALHRIEEYEVLDEQRFEPRSDFDVDAWIERAFQIEQGGSEHAVKVHFKPRAARYIRERKWHYSQKLTEHDDKSCTLEFVTQSLDEAKRWLLMYGSEAYVLEPKALRDMLHEEHMQAARQYEASSAA